MNETKLKRDLVIPAGTVLTRVNHLPMRNDFVALVDLDGDRKARLMVSPGAIEANPDLFGPKTDWEELRDGKPTLDDLDDDVILGVGV